MKTYREALEELYSLNVHKSMKLGLENVEKLDRLLGYPSKKMSFIHVAGTNGKGSVTIKIAKGLEEKHRKVGGFISPHISTLRERIRINEELISEEDVFKYLYEIFLLKEKEGIPATFFEVMTVLALKYFADKGVDIAVLETGLGGRLDATNIIHPLLCIITSIDFDHMEFLGNTLEAIGKEKAGIIKSGVPVILGPTAATVPVKDGCETFFVTGSFKTVEEENRAIARKALECLKISEPVIRKAITARLPCRREKVYFQDREVILDVAHNPKGLLCLFKELNIPREKLRVIFGISKNKDIHSCLQILKEASVDIHLVEAPNGRGANPKELKKHLIDLGMAEERVYIDETIEGALEAALQFSSRNLQELVVCGTFFIMSAARRYLGIEEPCDFRDMNEA